MSVYDMAVELGKNLSTSQEYAKVLDSQRAVSQDPEARSLVNDFQQLQKSYQRMQMMGHQLTQENLKKLSEMEKQASSHPLVKAYLDAQAGFYEVVNMVNVKIQEGLTGKSVSEDDPTGQASCSSTKGSSECGSCSGC
ncbi:YlbF family regulator [Desulforamulus aquiferis]|uniref:YlbF family regulator n=1 Tax=Desulforamulus aquiferis TaxID=1397668 RepID=A0AAW7ZIG3_9FIRM|nr:YlbF family regulator [Desulforamulus aquiferis]MDO7788996.1 YlbF family regulator [Desulforamulus aquiferis]RYD01390.1 hypothetical protein N752_30820 [Desulforamulus aquiferis]